MRIRAPRVVGRDRELDLLRQILESARRGRGRAVFLVGEGGIGKSRLASETVGRAYGSGMRVLQGRGSRVGPIIPFRPITEALLSLFRAGGPPDDPELDPYRPALRLLVPHWAPDGPAGEPSSLIILAEAILRLTSIVGRDGGCLLVLEDLQDADPETLAVVEYLVDNIDWQPTALLATIRNDPGDAIDLAWRAAQRDACTVLELDRLLRDDVRHIVDACLDAAPGDVPAAVGDLLWDSSAGVPFVVEELLHGMLSSGLLASGADGWRTVGDMRPAVPVTLARSIAARVDRLGPQGRAVLSIAAVLGRRFPISVVQAVCGLDDRSLLSHVHAGVAAQLLSFDELAVGWYSFQHPLTAEALLGQLSPMDRADISGRVADALQSLYPGLPGDWCQQAAVLRLDSGDTATAAGLFAEAGRRALAAGAAESAVALLSRADTLLAGRHDPVGRADVLESLLPALAEAGQFDRAFELAGSLGRLEGSGLEPRRLAALHLRLAQVAEVAGRWAEGMGQIEAARALLGPGADDASLAQLDSVAAELTIQAPGRDRIRVAEALARRAAAAAQRAGLPGIGCQALIMIGVTTMERDPDEAMACFRNAVALAEGHELAIWRIQAMLRAATVDYLRDGDPSGLESARAYALRVGAITVSCAVDATLAMHEVLCGRFVGAAEALDRCLADAVRMKISSTARYGVAARAVLAAHQGRRRDMEAALIDFGRWGGERSQEMSHVLGMARTFCALLEEDVELALREQAALRAYELQNPTVFQLTGRFGLQLLLAVLTGRAGWTAHEETSRGAASTLRWNRQFVLLAEAVLHGRAGRCDLAERAVAEAQEAAAPFGMARHLGLRLVAEPAHEDGWGSPVEWLRTAEEYFHSAAVPAVAGRCRALLRAYGAAVQQRRSGTDRIPRKLRTLGVTMREFEVLELLAERIGNKAVARRLCISPRTVEKHVASLIMKTDNTDRHALCEYAARLLP